MLIGVVTAPPGLQLTATLPLPGRVLLPITQLQVTWPLAGTALGMRPWATLGVPRGVVYEIEQVAPGGAWTLIDAVPRTGAPYTEINLTLAPGADA